MDGWWRTREARVSGASGVCLVGLAALVAISSRATADGDGGPLRTGSGAGHAVGAALLTIGLVGWMAATAVLVATLWPTGIRRLRRKPEDEAFEPYRPDVSWWEQAIVLALPVCVLAGLLAAVVLLDRGGGTAAPTTTFDSAVGPASRGVGASSGHAAAAPATTSGSTLAVAVIVAVGIVVIAAAALVIARRRRRPEMVPRAARPERELATALDWSLDDLRREPDPRRAVIAAYARMEGLLGEHGVRRHRWEAPLEYLRRARDRLRGGEMPIGELTDLFHEARFSPHSVGEPERARAVAVLTALRRELDA
jgi:Domain of unknown function (DUF4129)